MLKSLPLRITGGCFIPTDETETRPPLAEQPLKRPTPQDDEVSFTLQQHIHDCNFCGLIQDTQANTSDGIKIRKKALAEAMRLAGRVLHLVNKLKTSPRARAHFKRMVALEYTPGTEASTIRWVMGSVLTVELAMFFCGETKTPPWTQPRDPRNPAYVANDVHATLAPYFDGAYAEVSIWHLLVNYGILW